MRKNIQLLLLALVLVLGVALAPQAAEAYDGYSEYMPFGAPVTIHVNGNYLLCDVDPIIQNGRTLMPMRATAEAIGASVAWDNATRCVTVQKDDTLAYFFVGSNTYYVNDVAMTSDVPAQIMDGRTLLPLRDFAEALGVRVDWDQYRLDVGLSTTGERYSLPQIPLDVENDVARWLEKYYIPSDVSDGVVGSWVHRGYENSSSWEYYNFIYKVPGGYQNIEVTIDKSYSLPKTNTTIVKNSMWQTNDTFRRVNYERIQYYKGYIRGWAGYQENEYKMIGTNLVKIGWINFDQMTGLESCYTPKNDVYTRF